MKTLLRDLRDPALKARIPARQLKPDLSSGLAAFRSQLSKRDVRACIAMAELDTHGKNEPVCRETSVCAGCIPEKQSAESA